MISCRRGAACGAEDSAQAGAPVDAASARVGDGKAFGDERGGDIAPVDAKLDKAAAVAVVGPAACLDLPGTGHEAAEAMGGRGPEK